MSIVPFSTPKPGRDKTWGLIHSRQAAQLQVPNKPVVFYDAPPDEATLAQIESVHVWAPHDDPLTEMPALIARLPSLVDLSMGPGAIDPRVMTGLRADMLPDSLRHLSLHPSQNSYTWKGGPLPQLESLTVGAALRFEPEDFPALMSLSAVPDRRGITLDRALQLPLKELNLWNVPFDTSVFDRLAALPLVALGIVNGRSLDSLAGIEQLADLRSLLVKNQGILHTIRPIAALSNLQKLNIQYCKRIADIDVLGELSPLQELTLVGCGDVGLGKLEETLRARLRRSNIAATQ